MNTYIVTAAKLNKRSVVPANLPDSKNIAGIVFKGYQFNAVEAAPADVPNPALGKWFKDAAGFFYWGGAIALVHHAVVPVLPDNGIQLTALQLKAATGAEQLSTAEKFLPYMMDTCAKYKINTHIRQLCFLAQVGHESIGLYYTEELASGQAYEGRTSLGNIHPGDGVRFKGRGLIQITGRGNYNWLSKDFGVNFVNNPQLLGGKNASLCTPDQLKYATQSAGWYWNNHAINKLADLIDINLPIDAEPNFAHYIEITKKINGGTNGLKDRLLRYKGGVALFRP